MVNVYCQPLESMKISREHFSRCHPPFPMQWWSRNYCTGHVLVTNLLLLGTQVQLCNLVCISCSGCNIVTLLHFFFLSRQPIRLYTIWPVMNFIRTLFLTVSDRLVLHIAMKVINTPDFSVTDSGAFVHVYPVHDLCLVHQPWSTNDRE